MKCACNAFCHQSVPLATGDDDACLERVEKCDTFLDCGKGVESILDTLSTTEFPLSDDKAQKIYPDQWKVLNRSSAVR